MQNKARFSNIFFAALLLFVAPGRLPAQTPAKEQGVPSPVAIPQQTPTPTGNASDNGLAPVYGVQGVLIETLAGKVVSEQASDQKFNPASSIKLATAFVALRTFGPNYRFTTGFWTDG